MTKGKYSIPILEKNFQLLELLAEHPQGMTMQEAVDRLPIPKTTVFRLLTTLTEMGYVAKNIETGQYTISRGLLRLGLSSFGGGHIVEQAMPVMRELRDKIRETIMLGIFMNNRVVLIDQVLGMHDFTFMLRPGSDFCLHASAPGKIFLSHMEQQESERIMSGINFKKFNNNTITTIEAMREELVRIRERGYAIDFEEELYGVNCVATPIFDCFGNITATIWTSGPSGRLTREDCRTTGQELILAAAKISKNLGCKL